MMVFLLILTAVIAYLMGGINGAIVTSKYFFHKDIRNYGSGNAGLTNYYRTFGPVGVAMVIGIDVLKSVIAILIGGWLMKTQGAETVGRLFAGFCLILGHSYPVYYGFRGGKGVLCGGVMALLADWRVGLLCWAVFAIVVIFTRYVSLGSILSSMSCFLWMLAFDHTSLEVILALLCGLLITVKHAENILRLIGGTERKLSIQKGRPRK